MMIGGGEPSQLASWVQMLSRSDSPKINVVDEKKSRPKDSSRCRLLRPFFFLFFFKKRMFSSHILEGRNTYGGLVVLFVVMVIN